MSPLILSLRAMNLQQSNFKCTMKANVVVAMEPPFHVNPFTQLWQILSIFQIPKNFFPEFFNLAEIDVIQVSRSVEDEHTFSTLSFLKSKLWNRLCEHLPIVVGMFSQPFFTLNNFPYDATFEKWKVAKVHQMEA